MNEIITRLSRRAPILVPDDTVRRAASLIGGTEGSSMIVMSGTQILGTVSEKSIAASLALADDPETALDSPVSALIDHDLTFINFGVTIREAAGIFAAKDADMLPVIDNFGKYLGVVYRSDILGYITHSMKMPSVGGMATPLGVYLTTGSLSGGAGTLGLVLSGAVLGLCLILSLAMANGIMDFVGWIIKIPIRFYLASPALSVLNIHDIPHYALMALHILIFRTMLYYSSLAGYHAAEHMTVNAIEAGEILTPATVGMMSRVHPRCGTNLLAAISIFMMLTQYSKDQNILMMAGLVTVLFWRSIGGWMQQYVTTRKPTDKQLASGIAAGKELIERYHKQPHYQAVGFARIWKMGLVQNAMGLMSLLFIIERLSNYFHLTWLMF